VCFFVFGASAIDYVFPPAAKVIDVTQPPYSADRSGKTDVSAILTKAANDNINIPSWCPGILYFPNGTYLLRNTFAWRLNSSGNGMGPILIGQSRTGTVIKLAKGTWPLGTELKGAIQTGAGAEQNFDKGIRNLTVLVDSNNAGAIGIVYVSDNTGMISDVNVISADGKGAYGILSSGGVIPDVGCNGPFIIRRTYIKGFQVGMRACGTQSEMISQIRLEGQSKLGIWVSCIDLIIDSLSSNNTCQALWSDGSVILTHALLTGGASYYAIHNGSYASYFSDVKTSGYTRAIESAGINRPPTGSSFVEYTPVPPVSLFSTAKTSMNLPARYPPEVAWETDFSKWAFIENYKTNGRNDAQALQAAIDDPAKTTVCLVGKNVYQLDRAVHVRGNINRIIGTGATFSSTSTTNAQIIVDDGTAPVVIMQNIACPPFSNGNYAQLVKQTSRTLVLESISDGFTISVTGGGETYLTDEIPGITVNNPQARVYIWQWEGSLTVRSGVVRAVGDYHEGGGTSYTTCLGGITEILGRLEYLTTCGDDKTGKYLIGVGNGASISVAGVWQQSFCTSWNGYDALISETQGTTTKILYSSAGAGRTVSPAGRNIALFTDYDSIAVRNALVTGAREAKPVAVNKDILLWAARTHRGIEVTYSVLSPAPATLRAYDISGRIISIVKERSGYAGTHQTLIPSNGLSAGIVCVELRQEGQFRSRQIIPH
jgi:hypothetical protein